MLQVNPACSNTHTHAQVRNKMELLSKDTVLHVLKLELHQDQGLWFQFGLHDALSLNSCLRDCQ